MKSKPDWESIKQASIRGVADATLAEAFGVSRAAIRQRRHRERWLGGQRRAIVTKRDGCSRESLAASGERAAAIANLALAEIAEHNPLMVARFAQARIEEAIAQGSVGVPESWQDFNAAVRMVRQAVGLERETPAVAFNLWPLPGCSSEPAPFREIDPARARTAGEA